MTSAVGRAAPELLEVKASRNHKIDQYAYAILVFEVFARVSILELTASQNYEDFKASVLRGARPVLPADFNAQARDLVTACWAREPRARPEFGRVLACLVLGDTSRLGQEGWWVP